MLSVDGDADAAVEARIRIGWNEFMQLVPLHTYYIWYITDYERETVQQLCAKWFVVWKWNLTFNERKWGGTSEGRDENGQMNVWG